MKIETRLPLLDSILDNRQQALGRDFEPYKNHVYRMLHFCCAFHECRPDDKEKLIIAGCFHDLGIWPGGIIDYLAPSIELAKKYLLEVGKEGWAAEIATMIDQHHKLTTVKNCPYPLVEIFRKGDWVDASLGIRKFGLAIEVIHQVQSAFPNLGFHKNLLRLGTKELFINHRNPLPMMKW